MDDLADLLENQPIAPPTLAGTPTERKHRHQWAEAWRWFEDPDKSGPGCARCKRGRHWECHGCSCPCSYPEDFGGYTEAHEAAVSAIAPRVDADVPWDDRPRCLYCGKLKDEALSRRGKNNRSRGNAIEREVAAQLGLRRVGQFGGPDDIKGAMFAGQVKSGAAFSEKLWRWLKAVPVDASQTAILVITDAPGPGHRRRAVVVVDLADWIGLHGPEVEAVQ